jgi:biopolymer transport protein ExbB
VDAYLESLKGPDARVMQAIRQACNEGIGDLDSVASRVGSEELQRMERGFRTLSILGHTAPLLGLLGTVIGMIKAFMVIEIAGGQVDSQALAGGIWEAMLTTGVGLTVAVPVLLLLHMLESAADKRAHGMRRSAMLLLELLSSKQKSGQGDAIHHRKGVIHAV